MGLEPATVSGIVSSQLALLAQLDTKSVCQYMTAAILNFVCPMLRFKQSFRNLRLHKLLVTPARHTQVNMQLPIADNGLHVSSMSGL